MIDNETAFFSAGWGEMGNVNENFHIF